MTGTVDIRRFGLEILPDLAELFASHRSASACWCMWFIIRVRDFHAGGASANARRFSEVAAGAQHPVGLLAYRNGEPVGWAACGPRSRYARAVKTPTMRAADQSENDSVWLAPCFFIRPDMRGRGIAHSLLAGAIALAQESGATAIEGFPTADSKKGSADQQVGAELLFASCGFRPVSRPSSNRVVMRLDL